MQTQDFLRELCAQPGLTGSEMKAAEYVAAAFRPYVDEVRIDKLYNVIARVRARGPSCSLPRILMRSA